MAAQDKSQRATPWRRRKARQKGQVARSADLTAAASFLAVLLAFSYAGPKMAALGLEMMRTALQRGHTSFTVAEAAVTYRLWLLWGLEALAPVLALAALGALLANVGQVGFIATTYPLRWNLSRISPGEGLRRLISVQGLAQTVKSLLKVGLLLALSAWVLRQHLLGLLSLGPASLPTVLGAGLRAVGDLCLKCGGALALLGLADYAYQRYMHERSLRMTHQEVREEQRETEGDPQIEARRRQRRRQLLEGGISREMPQATVVVTNPTHLAVALRYERDMAAPVVVAKGAGLLAEHIRRYADRYAIPVHQDRTLARSLYRQGRLGKPIPPGLYPAVAEVLAVILRRREQLRQRRSGSR